MPGRQSASDSRAKEIRRLRICYRGYMLERKWKAAMLVWFRLRDLMNRQLRAEIRQDAKAAANP